MGCFPGGKTPRNREGIERSTGRKVVSASNSQGHQKSRRIREIEKNDPVVLVPSLGRLGSRHSAGRSQVPSFSPFLACCFWLRGQSQLNLTRSRKLDAGELSR